MIWYMISFCEAFLFQQHLFVQFWSIARPWSCGTTQRNPRTMDRRLAAMGWQSRHCWPGDRCELLTCNFICKSIKFQYQKFNAIPCNIMQAQCDIILETSRYTEQCPCFFCISIVHGHLFFRLRRALRTFPLMRGFIICTVFHLGGDTRGKKMQNAASVHSDFRVSIPGCLKPTLRLKFWYTVRMDCGSSLDWGSVAFGALIISLLRPFRIARGRRL